MPTEDLAQTIIYIQLDRGVTEAEKSIPVKHSALLQINQKLSITKNVYVYVYPSPYFEAG